MIIWMPLNCSVIYRKNDIGPWGKRNLRFPKGKPRFCPICWCLPTWSSLYYHGLPRPSSWSPASHKGYSLASPGLFRKSRTSRHRVEILAPATCPPDLSFPYHVKFARLDYYKLVPGTYFSSTGRLITRISVQIDFTCTIPRTRGSQNIEMW